MMIMTFLYYFHGLFECGDGVGGAAGVSGGIKNGS